jgi:hypothetical protein
MCALPPMQNAFTSSNSRGASRSDEIETRLHGRRLSLARLAYAVLVLLALALFVASIPSYWVFLHHLCTSSACLHNVQLTPTDLAQLHGWGISLDFYAAGLATLYVLGFLVFASVAAVVFWRRSDDWIALLTSFYLVLFPLGGPESYTLQTLPSAWLPAVDLVKFLGEISAFTLGYIFPTGHFVPRWTRWLLAAMIPYWLINVLLPSSPPWSTPLIILNVGPFLGWIGSVVAAQTYRYRHVSGPVHRQQTKWLVFGASVGFGCELIGQILYRVIIPVFLHGSQLVYGIVVTVVGLSWVLIPVSIAIALLRYRLWDIDVIINRTLVYGGLSATLVSVYVVSILGLQALFGGLFRQTSALAVVVSTLAIAALFQPLRTRIQAGIDHRFYRSKYDAARALTAFSATLQENVDLSQLSEQLISIVEETMQPAHIWLWLRPAEPPQQQPTQLAAPLRRETTNHDTLAH